jgi:uncharacterized membrane protein (DUF2068 family)
MTETPPAGSYVWHTAQDEREEEQVSDVRALARARYERAGWLNFAATMLMVLGAFQVIDGLTALFRSGTYLVGEDGLAVNVDYTVWGWVHLILGLIAVAAGFGLLRAQAWARYVGIAMAVVSAIVNLAFIPAHPFASIVVIFLDIVVIYGIAVYGEPPEKSGY